MNIEIDINELRKTGLFVGTPAYGGLLTAPYHTATIDLVNRFRELRIPLKHCIIENESLITRARNNIVHMFMHSEYTHLLFIDADIRFSVNDVLSLLHFATQNHAVIAGNYPKKAINWESVEKAVKLGAPADQLKNYIDNSVMNLLPSPDGKRTIKIDEPIEVLDTGTGFMMIRKDVFTKMGAAYPELKYTPDYALGNPGFDNHRAEGVFAFFDTMIAPDETSPEKKAAGVKRYLSEDYTFCKLWREIGGKITVCPWINLTHHGSYHYQGNVPDVLRMQAAWSSSGLTLNSATIQAAQATTGPSQATSATGKETIQDV